MIGQGLSSAGLKARAGRLVGFDDPLPAPHLHAGDHVTDPGLVPWLKDKPLRDAAVLLAVTPDGDLILTRRTDHLRSHSGQVALPGGKVDAEDASPLAAALREAQEEIGLERSLVEPIGLLAPYITYSAYRIFPVVGLLKEVPKLTANPDEVAEVFDVPLNFLMRPENHQLEQRLWQGEMRSYYAMPYKGYRIWGVTAGILRLFYQQVFA